MNFFNRRTKRWITIIVLLVIAAMVLTMVLPYVIW